MCFGQGVTVTLLQMAHAYSVFANEGELKPLSMIKVNEHRSPNVNFRIAEDFDEIVGLRVGEGDVLSMREVHGFGAG